MDGTVNPLLALGVGLGLAAVVALLFWPRRGLLARWRKAQRMSDHVRHEDALKQIYKLEMKGQPVTLAAVAGAIQTSQNETAALLQEMEDAGLLRYEAAVPALTPRGREAALHIIRAHRLWETYLAEETGFDEADWHALAEAQEHGLSDADLRELAARLSFPAYDPHGDPIPAPGGTLVDHGGVPLATLDRDTPARIVHLEDEPETVYAQLVAERLAPGMPVRLTSVSAERVRFWANGDEHVLAPVVAANVFVRPAPVLEVAPPPHTRPLTSLALGESAEVVGPRPRPARAGAAAPARPGPAAGHAGDGRTAQPQRRPDRLSRARGHYCPALANRPV